MVSKESIRITAVWLSCGMRIGIGRHTIGQGGHHTKVGAMDTIEGIDIRDESSSETRYQLYINNERRGLVTVDDDSLVKIRWQAVGPFSLDESRVWVQGLLELLMIAEQLELRNDHGKKSSGKRRGK